jgi:hypothetical protein
MPTERGLGAIKKAASGKRYCLKVIEPKPAQRQFECTGLLYVVYKPFLSTKPAGIQRKNGFLLSYI